ncbi:TfpX/TfpZ family type IV pilin accessory protein [Hydrogenophaga palleronii]|nr:TfpX/TfpZ family type IV pilin accessory protein [Hydrogenophaga palleronii]
MKSLAQSQRMAQAVRASLLHVVCSLAVALLAGALVFGLWYPFPYSEMAGGRELFLLIVGVDVVCGPLLTLVIYSPHKPRSELVRDIGMVVLIQLVALGYGLWTVIEARPLFLVHEVDRFKVVAMPDIEREALATLPVSLRPTLFSKPRVVAIREPLDEQERDKVLFAALAGGRDYAERPEFYLPYEGESARKTLIKASPLTLFLERYPDQVDAAKAMALKRGGEEAQWFTLPVIARQDWVAVLDENGQLQGFLQGDGF